MSRLHKIKLVFLSVLSLGCLILYLQLDVALWQQSSMSAHLIAAIAPSWRQAQKLHVAVGQQHCISTTRKFSVLQGHYWDRVFKEVREFVLAALRGHLIDVNTPTWPLCLEYPVDHPDTCLGRTNVVTFFCCDDETGDAVMRLAQAPHDTTVVLFNLEVADSDKTCFHWEQFRSFWREAAVWDYSYHNVAKLAELAGSTGANMDTVPLTYYPGIGAGGEHIPLPPLTGPLPNGGWEFDVLMLASRNDRRNAIIGELERQGFRVKVVHEAWGAERDSLVQRSAVLLNVHYFEAKLMEAVRLFYVLSLGACVVSEVSPDKKAMQYWTGAVAFAPYDEIVAVTLRHLTNSTLRHEQATKGYHAIRRITPRDALRPALEMALLWSNTSFHHQPCQ